MRAKDKAKLRRRVIKWRALIYAGVTVRGCPIGSDIEFTVRELKLEGASVYALMFGYWRRVRMSSLHVA